MLSTRQVEFMMQMLEETLAEYSFIPAYEFTVDNYPGDGWCIESEHYDDGMKATVTIQEMSRISDEDMKSVAIEQLISNIVDRHSPKKKKAKQKKAAAIDSCYVVVYQWNPRKSDPGIEIYGPYLTEEEAQAKFAETKASVAKSFRETRGDSIYEENSDTHFIIDYNDYEEWEEVTVKQIHK